jgi:tetratricopeptide (TPR) repeat protein
MDPNEIARIMGRTEGRFLPSVVETLKSHESPASYVGFVWRKFAATWHGYEMPNNASFYYHRLYSRTLRLLPVTFYLLSPLALVGLGLGLSHRRIGWPLYLLASTHLLVMLIALVQSRYRMPLVVALLPFAALTIVRCVEGLQARWIKRTAAIVVLVALLGLWTSQRLPPEVKIIRDADCTALLRWHLQEHGLTEAREYLTAVLEVAPNSVGALLSLGDVERHDANYELAVAHYEAALGLDPGNRYAREQLQGLTQQPGLSRIPPS